LDAVIDEALDEIGAPEPTSTDPRLFEAIAP
jgi:hypothetical protein